MKKQVAKILGNMAHEIKRCDSKDPVLGLEIKQATLQICQKFPKTIDNPDGYEPRPKRICVSIPEVELPKWFKGLKPDDGIPLTDMGRTQQVGNKNEDCFTLACVLCGDTKELTLTAHRSMSGKVCGWLVGCISCQPKLCDFHFVDAKTASIVRAENQELRNEERRYFEAKTTEAKEFVRAECQERVDGIFKEIERYFIEVLGHNPKELREWQALKKEGVK